MWIRNNDTGLVWEVTPEQAGVLLQELNDAEPKTPRYALAEAPKAEVLEPPKSGEAAGGSAKK